MERPRAAKDERVWQFIGYLGAYSGDIEIENMLKVMNFEIAIKNDLFYESLLKLKKRRLMFYI